MDLKHESKTQRKGEHESNGERQNSFPPDGGRQSEYQEVIDDATRDLIRRKARRLISQAGQSISELPDAEQALRLVLLSAHSVFDPALGKWLPYAERAIQQGCKNLLRQQFAGKRDPRRAISLQITVKLGDAEGYTDLAEFISELDARRRLGVHQRDVDETTDMRLDVEAFIDGLSPNLRKLAEALRYESILEISRRTDTPRSTLYGQVKQLREAAANTVLGQFL